MVFPDYKKNSIANLTSTILTHFGGKSPYSELEILYSLELKDNRNIVLLVIDGLGYNYLIQNFRY